MVDLLIRLTQCSPGDIPPWLIGKKKYLNQRQLEILYGAPQFEDHGKAKGKKLYRVDDTVYKTHTYRQSSDDDGDYGSMYAENSCNYQQMKREMRACLAFPYYDDVDMVDAHNRLFLGDCEERGLFCGKDNDSPRY
jgi:hypothetical protein